MAGVRVTYELRPDATPESELNALSACYAFILQRHQEKQKATRPGGPDDAKEIKNVRAETIIPK
jgi:hypothetical protein